MTSPIITGWRRFNSVGADMTISLRNRVCPPGTLDKAMKKWQFVMLAREFPTIKRTSVELWHEECERLLARYWPQLMDSR